MSLISPDILHAFDKVKTANGDPEKSHVWYAFRNGQEEESNREEPIMEIASEIVHCNASRVQFLDGLVKLIPKSVKVEFGKKVIDVIPSADGKGQMKIIFEGGLEREANAVIGCDGIRSACRRILLGQDSRAIYSGKYAYRKVVNMEKAVEVVGEEVRNRLIYLGKGGHVLMFPIRRGEMLNVVAFKDGGEKEWADKRWVVPSDREDLLEDFKGWNRKVRNILKVC
jgi:salicylate hydroxylase